MSFPSPAAGGPTSNSFSTADIAPILGSLASFFPASGGTTNSIGNKSGSQTNDIWQFFENLLNTSNLVNTSGQTNTSGGSTVTPTMSPEATQFMNQLIGRFSDQAKPVDMSGIRQQGITDINTSSDLQKQAVDQIMASRGLSTSPVTGTSLAGVEGQRGANINQFTNSLPALSNALNLANLNAAGGFLNMIPKGVSTSTVGQTSNVGQTSQAGQTSQSQTTTGANKVLAEEHTTGKEQGSVGLKTGDIIGNLAGVAAATFPPKRNIPTK